ncbi:reverse transcriptase [Artemisia annua]|uniref:Reverse transcriptase n=1 Tax=Artemisia annua TaxID=35608 RepID=A0A2U1QDG2_ARTAN|nr:reverse transcriptase [Artemisia annua]
MNSDLQAPVSDVEIYKAAKQLGGLKAPGEDGFSGIFYQKYWHVVGASVCKVVRSFFETGEMLQNLNKTFGHINPQNFFSGDLNPFPTNQPLQFYIQDHLKGIDEQSYLPATIRFYPWPSNSRLHGGCS